MVEAGFVRAMSIAPIGAACRVPGFEAWIRALGGWHNTESGVTLEPADLAARIEQAENLGSVTLVHDDGSRLEGTLGEFHGEATVKTARGTRYVATFAEMGWRIEEPPGSCAEKAPHEGHGSCPGVTWSGLPNTTT